MINTKIDKTILRLHEKTYELKEMKHMVGDKDGLFWSETFDGKFTKNGVPFLINLKFICDKGGAQNRSSKEVNRFMDTQIEYIKKNKDNKFIFLNILDGDGCSYWSEHFKNLYNCEESDYIKKYVYIGDMYTLSNNLKNYF